MAFFDDVFKNIGNFFSGGNQSSNNTPSAPANTYRPSISNPFSTPGLKSSAQDQADEEERKRQAAIDKAKADADKKAQIDAEFAKRQAALKVNPAPVNNNIPDPTTPLQKAFTPSLAGPTAPTQFTPTVPLQKAKLDYKPDPNAKSNDFFGDIGNFLGGAVNNTKDFVANAAGNAVKSAATGISNAGWDLMTGFDKAKTAEKTQNFLRNTGIDQLGNGTSDGANAGKAVGGVVGNLATMIPTTAEKVMAEIPRAEMAGQLYSDANDAYDRGDKQTGDYLMAEAKNHEISLGEVASTTLEGILTAVTMGEGVTPQAGAEKELAKFGTEDGIKTLQAMAPDEAKAVIDGLKETAAGNGTNLLEKAVHSFGNIGKGEGAANFVKDMTLKGGPTGAAFNVAGTLANPNATPEDYKNALISGYGGGMLFSGLSKAGSLVKSKFTGSNADNAETPTLDTPTTAPIIEDAQSVPSTGETGTTQDPNATEVAPGVHTLTPPELSPAPDASTIATEPTTTSDAQPVQQELPMQIPDPTSDMTLAKSDAATNQPLMADFKDAVQAPDTTTTPAPATPAVEPTVAPADIPPVETTPTTADTNPVDPQTQAMIDERTKYQDYLATDGGKDPAMDAIVQGKIDKINSLIGPDQAVQSVAPATPTPETPPVTPLEATTAPTPEEIAAQTTDAQVENPDASRARNAVANNTIEDQVLREDVVKNFKNGDKMNIEQVTNDAKAAINNLTDEEIIQSYQNTPQIDTPEEFIRSVEAIKRLQSIGTAEARAAIINALDGIDQFKGEAGQNMRIMQVLYEDMPVSMQKDFLVKKIEKLSGRPMLDSEMTRLDELVTKADNAATGVKDLRDQANAAIDKIHTGSVTPEDLQSYRKLSGDISKAERVKGLANGEVDHFLSQYKPKATIGARVGEFARTAMLSSPLGRVFHIASTSATAADDILTKNVAALLGKAVNKFTSDGNVQDTLASPYHLAKGVGEGARMAGDNFAGNHSVDSLNTAVNDLTAGNITHGDNVIKNTIRSAVELPTALARGMREDSLYSQGMQEAAQQGLSGADQQAYAELRAAAPSSEQLSNAIDAQAKTTMLHKNGISSTLNKMAKGLDDAGQGVGASLIRNQIMPFTSWMGGNINRALTDKNVLWNAGSIIKSAFNGDTQGIVNNFAKLAVNTGEAYAVATILTKTGVLTNQDANGDNYDGVYFHVGDKYIPVAIAGTLAIPIIIGNAVQNGLDAAENGGDFWKTTAGHIVGNTINSLGVSSTFGGQNNLQTTVDSLKTAATKPDEVVPALTKYAGGVGRQFIPSVTSDINAGLNFTGLNPTGEAANTTVVDPLTGKTDAMASELAKWQNTIPGASQALPRKVGTPAQDLIDRALRGTHDTAETKAVQATKDSLLTITNDMKKQGIPTDDKGIQARFENGKYDDAIKGYNYQLAVAKSKKDTPPSDIKKIEDQVALTQVMKNNKYTMDDLNSYKSTSLDEWRAMGDPESDTYDPEMYKHLYNIDKNMASVGQSGKKGDGTKGKFYAAKKKGSGSGSSAKSFNVDMATNSFSSSPDKLLAKSAASEVPAQSIPILQKAANNDTSRLRKITVSKGVQ